MRAAAAEGLAAPEYNTSIAGERRNFNGSLGSFIGETMEQTTETGSDLGPLGVNAIGIPRDKLNKSPGRPKGARNLHAKHPSSIAKAFKRAGLDWQADFALAIKNNKRERIRLWLRLLPYLITQRNHATTVKRWKGKASRAAMVALQALEGK